jgi:hypothetical protein
MTHGDYGLWTGLALFFSPDGVSKHTTRCVEIRCMIHSCCSTVDFHGWWSSFVWTPGFWLLFLLKKVRIAEDEEIVHDWKKVVHKHARTRGRADWHRRVVINHPIEISSE